MTGTAQFFLGSLYGSMGNQDEALASLRKAAAAGNPTGKMALLIALLDRGLLDEARGLAREILADPDPRAFGAFEAVLSIGPAPSPATLAALRRARETLDVDALLDALS